MNWVNQIFSQPNVGGGSSASAQSSPAARPATTSSTGHGLRESIRRNSLFNSVAGGGNPSSGSVSGPGSGSKSVSTCNDLVDTVINYIKNNNISQLDPYNSEDKVAIDVGTWASLVITSTSVNGCSSMERCGNFTYKSQTTQSTGDSTLTVAGNVKFSYVRAEFKFDAKFGKTGHRVSLKGKSIFLWLEEVIIHIELAISVRRQTVRMSSLKVVAITNLEGKTGGLSWPMNRIGDTILRRQITNWKNKCQSHLERLRIMINEMSADFFGDILGHVNITDFID